jgi:signal transduction histidine kinase
MKFAPMLSRIGGSLVTGWRPQPDGPRWAPWAWTAALNTLIALLLTLLVPRTGSFASNLLISQSIGLTIHALFFLLGHGLSFDMFGLPLPIRMAYVASVALAGSWLGYAGAWWLKLGNWQSLVDHLGKASGFLLVLPIVWAVVTVTLLALVNRLRSQQLGRERERSARIRAEREAIAARLQLLNAQIEPHFLYNTLANVAALIPPEAGQAGRLVDALTRYLRASSRNMTRTLVPLEDELESVRGYLDVMQIRLGERLRVRYEVAIDPGQGPVLPPAALQTLVENAIKHGIEPKPQGGEFVVSASSSASAWVIEVIDSGRGLPTGSAGSHGGTGLANLAERLRLALGADARLSLESREGGGARARIVLPLSLSGPKTAEHVDRPVSPMGPPARTETQAAAER